MKTKHFLYPLIIVALCLVSLHGNAQDKKSSFKEVNVNQKLDEANKQVLKSPKTAFDLATEALEISFNNNDKRAEARAYNTFGTLYYNAGNYQKAIEYFIKAKNIYQNIDDAKNEEYTLKYLGKSYEALEQNDISSGYYDLAEKRARTDSAKTDYKISNSRVKKKMGKNEEAISDLEDELNKKGRSLPPNQKIDIYLELGDLYLAKEDTTKGVILINKAINNADDKDKTPFTDSIKVITLNRASDIYTKNNLYTFNVDAQKEAINSGAAGTDINYTNSANFNLGMTYLEKQPLIAANYFQQSAELTKNKPKELDHVKAIEKLSEAYERSGEYSKALEKYKEYIVLVDSIKQSEITSKLKNEILSSQFEVQESRIRELENKQLERDEELRVQRNTILALVIGIALFLILTYFLVKNIRQKQRSNIIIQLASLRSQMNPHFIFNSLNSVNGFISKNEEIKANRYLSDFSKLMRSVLNNSNNETITLGEELASLRIYLSLEHSRFDDKFNFEISIDPSINTEEIDIPPMLIQPYLENAIWHGLRYKEGMGFLQLNISKKDKQLQVVITDNGIGREQSQKLKTAHQRDYKSTGIRNTKERIRLLNKLHKTNLHVTIKDLEEDGQASGTRVEIYLPLLKHH